MSRGDIVLAAVGLCKSHRRGPEEIHAVQDVSIELRAGSSTALVGPSGSGKTTLLNLLIGWESLDRGSIDRPGVSPAPRWSQIAVVPQALGLLEELTIRENVELPARVARRTLDIMPFLSRLEIDEIADRFPSEISLGEQQRTAIARALAHGSHIVLADEPTSHQDETSATRVLGVLMEAAASGAAVLIATHDRRVIESADAVWKMRDGQLIP